MMRNIYPSTLLACFILLFCLFALQVEGQVSSCDSNNDELTSKFRFLGEWDSQGTPEYMVPASDEVSQALIDFVNVTLPERVNFAESNEEYFGINVQLNTELKDASKVYLTMVHEGANWKNTLGYYTYDINNPPATIYDIDSLVILFPNVSQIDVIKPGDKVLLGDFPENTGIGYFLIVRGWVSDGICVSSHVIFTDSHLNTFTTEEYRQHTILLSCAQENKFLLGFEDMARPGGDNDFNDAVFYITADPGAIDTTNIAKVPTALLSGDTTLCDANAPATISVELTGKSPWSIVYNNGTEEVEVNDIENNVYTFETIVKDTITLVSVQDNSQVGIAEGKAVIKLSSPKAILNEEQVICNNGDDVGGFVIDLEGEAPYSLTFMVDNEEKTIENIEANQIEISSSIGQRIELIAMRDKYCDGDVVGGSAVVQSYSNPGLTIEGNGSICGDNTSTVFNLNLDGEGPWVVNYSLGEEEFELPIETSEYPLELSDPGSLTFNSVENDHCFVELQSIYNIANTALPTAVIENYENLCGEFEANVNISLSGSGPWVVNYRMNGEAKIAESTNDELSINIDQKGLFELIAVADANCENSSEGTAEIDFYESPSALMSGDKVICDEEAATVLVELTGTAPFTLVYTDGETETTITTDDSFYEFTTNEYKTFNLVSLIDANCNGLVEGSATISDGSEDVPVEIETEDVSCYAENINLTLLGDTDNLLIEWTTEGKGTIDNPNGISATYSPAENETGIIVFYAEVSNGCAVKTISKEVEILEEINADFEISPDQDLLTNTQITFTPANNEYDEYSWEFGDGNTSSATIASTEYSEGGQFTVELKVIKSSCEGTGSNELEVLSKDELYVPNAFNPNAQNSENQVVKVYGNNVDEFGFSFKIVNRWGKVMYETSSFDEANQVGWHGINKNTSEELELNVFTYILKGQFIEGLPFERTGTVTQVK